jgi:hypothetical protein
MQVVSGTSGRQNIEFECDKYCYWAPVTGILNIPRHVSLKVTINGIVVSRIYPLNNFF